MKISVIITVYNSEKYLIKCLESIINQTYKNLEIIVVDDGSSDNSRLIIDNYACRDIRIKTIFQKNQGATKARLKGLSKATGDYIGFVDSDDELQLDMYENLVENAILYDADISHCGYKLVFDDGRERNFYDTGKLIVQQGLQGVIDLLDGEIVEPGLWSKLFKATIIKEFIKNDKMDTEIKYNEDLLMNYYLFSKSRRSVFIDKCWYLHYVHEGSISHELFNYKKIYDPIKVKEIICNYSSLEERPYARKALLLTYIDMYNSILLEGKASYKIELKKIRKKIRLLKKHVNSLEHKRVFMTYMIIYFPFGYLIIYKIYGKFFQKKKYC